MKSSVLAGVVALAMAAPTATFASGSGGRPVMPQGFTVRPQAHPQVFNLQHQVHPQAPGQPQVFANRWRRPFAGYGYYGGPYSTLSSGTFDSAPPEDVDAGLVPPPGYGIPYYYPPPARPCIRPLLIHVGPMHRRGKLPRVVYGTPDTACAG